jgi:hypothetical protein
MPNSKTLGNPQRYFAPFCRSLQRISEQPETLGKIYFNIRMEQEMCMTMLN